MSPLLFVSALLLVLSLMWPSEGAMQGDGLPIALGWLITAGIAGVRKGGRASSVSLAGGWGVAMLLLAFWISCGQVADRSGDRAAATFLTLEWSALIALWLLLRIMTPAVRSMMFTVLLATCVGTAFYGFAKYFVLNQQTVEWYQAQLARLDAATTQTERQSIERELQQQGVPSDRTGRELFQRRLLDSTEPTGPFALANTFAGVLAVAFVLLLGVLTDSGPPRRSPSVWWSCLLSAAAIGFCLVLTKSRTAWVGCGVGMAVVLVQRLRSARQLWKAAALAGGLAVMTLGLGIGTGLLDREVVLESPKSLQYRLFYWMGASGVIAESPVCGVGPGNFRQAYLRYKVAESSEEILDPHNIFFDTGATLGLLGLAGLVGMLISIVLAHRSPDAGSADDAQTDASSADGLPADQLAADSPTARPQPGDARHTNRRQIPRTLRRVAAMCVVLLTGVRFLRGESLLEIANPQNSQTLLLVIPIVMAVLATLWNSEISLSRSTLTAAFCALLVHLCGAGGLQITVCGLLLMMLHSAVTQPTDESRPTPAHGTHAQWPVLVGGGLSLLVASSAAVMLVQHLRSAHYSRMATVQLAAGDLSGALEAAEKAVAAEPSANSRQQIAQVLSYAVLEAAAPRAPDLRQPAENQAASRAVSADIVPPRLEEALKNSNVAIENLIAADRRSTAGPQMRSQLLEVVLTWFPQRAFAETAIEDLRFIVVNYPTNVQAWCRLALLQQQWGAAQEASESRDRALALEDINRSWGHVDRYLSDEQIQQLTAIGSEQSDKKAQ